MGDVLPFARPKTADKAKAKGKTLCRHGFHKWRVDKHRRFEVREGRLLTVYRCERCGATKHKAE